jgi:hypothetical protein
MKLRACVTCFLERSRKLLTAPAECHVHFLRIVTRVSDYGRGLDC